MTERDPRVDDYLRGLPGWQHDLGQRVRELVLGVDPEMTETIKRTVQPYFVLQGNVVALLGTKDHLNVFLYDPLLDDPRGVITHGHDNATGRQVSLYEDDELDEQGLSDLVRQIVEHNRAGGWRTLGRDA